MLSSWQTKNLKQLQHSWLVPTWSLRCVLEHNHSLNALIGLHSVDINPNLPYPLCDNNQQLGFSAKQVMAMLEAVKPCPFEELHEFSHSYANSNSICMVRNLVNILRQQNSSPGNNAGGCAWRSGKGEQKYSDFQPVPGYLSSSWETSVFSKILYGKKFLTL